MKRKHLKAVLAVAWVLIVSAGAMASNMMPASGWLVLAIVALLPPIVMFRLWKDPPETISESIRSALR
jgi:hypothetical protein